MGAFKLDYGNYFYCTKKCSKSNHLGNVLTLFTDKKIPVGTGTTVSYYKADLVSSMDYSPFGAPLKGRTFNGSSSRYGFGGHEKNNELEGAGNSYDMGDRWLDVRLGRTPKLDAKAAKKLAPAVARAMTRLGIRDPDATSLVHQPNGELRWWTFAGGIAT